MEGWTTNRTLHPTARTFDAALSIKHDRFARRIFARHYAPKFEKTRLPLDDCGLSGSPGRGITGVLMYLC
jgi:hypothetical protein